MNVDQLKNCRDSEEELIKKEVRKENLVYLTFEVEKIMNRLRRKNRYANCREKWRGSLCRDEKWKKERESSGTLNWVLGTKQQRQ